MPEPVAGEILPALEENEARLVALWLHGRSPATQRAYQADLAALHALSINHGAIPGRAR